MGQVKNIKNTFLLCLGNKDNDANIQAHVLLRLSADGRAIIVDCSANGVRNYSI